MEMVRRFRAAVVSVVTAGLLAACGGGVWIGIGDFDGDGRPPSVSLVAATTVAPAGGTVSVAAAAADDDGIDEVAFYRRDGGVWVLLGSDRASPYQWVVPVPADGRTTLEVLARATDRTGQQADSAVLTLPVQR